MHVGSPWLKREGQNIADLWLFAFFTLRVVHKDGHSTHIDKAKALSHDNHDTT
jgi:hypothetical protein